MHLTICKVPCSFLTPASVPFLTVFLKSTAVSIHSPFCLFIPPPQCAHFCLTPAVSSCVVGVKKETVEVYKGNFKELIALRTRIGE